MYENNYMYAIERSPEYLAHYGIMGMKWGVRKAVASGNSARLSKHYAKAQKKLAKLEKRAAKSGKYARRAALMGAGAAAAGGLAVVGTTGVSKFMKENAKFAGKATRGVGGAMVKGGQLASKLSRGKVGGKAIQAGYTLQSKGIRNANAVYNAGRAVDTWGRSNSIGKAARAAGNNARNALQKVNVGYGKISGSQAIRKVDNALVKAGSVNTQGHINRLANRSNNTYARIAAGAVGAGLAVGAARNAYKAATAQKKAEKFRSAMNESFKGTKYANSGNRQGGKKRKRR